MPPAISFVVDHHDGTVSVDVTAVGAVDVYAAASPGGAWQVIGSLVGSGSLTAALPPGFYTFYASSPLDHIPSAPVMRGVASAGTLSVHEQVAEAIRGRVEQLSLPLTYHLFEQWTESDVLLRFPAIVFALDAMSETDESRTNATNDVGYPVRVMIADRSAMTDQKKKRAHMMSRMRIVRAFQGEQLESPRENWLCRVEFDPVFRADLAKFEWMVSELVVRAICREPRGLNV